MSGPGAPRRRVLLIEEGGVGGVADYTDELAAALAAAGWETHLATGRDHPPDAPAGVRVHRVFPYVRGRTAAGRALRRLGLSRLVNGLAHLAVDLGLGACSRRFDVVHVQGEEWPPLGAALALALRAGGRPVVYTPHNTFDRGERSYPRAHAIIRGCANRVVLHSEHDRAALPARQATRAVVIPHGEYGGLALRGGPVEPGAARARLGVAEDELLALLFGQLRPDKGVRDLLAAAAEVPGVRVALAGEDQGALEQARDLLADPRLAGRVLVREGFVPAQDAAALFAAADVVVLPYRRASASGVLLLAYGYARAVLCYPVGGLPEYVLDGRTGWLCDGADPEALARGLRAVLAAGREECRARGEAALLYSRERFAWPRIAQQTIELYEAALRSS